MDDLISRQALMKEFSDFVRASNNSDFARTPTWNDAVSLVGSMPSAQQWIPCSERLPTGQTEVIASIYDDSGDTPFDYTASGWVTDDGEYWIVDGEINYYVVAWTPLPEPYQSEAKRRIE